MTGAAGRPGRVQQIAQDRTPITGPPDVDSRLGWLLAMSRLHHPDPQMGVGGRFLEALADAGVPASRSLVSRWESGAVAVSYEGLTGYEKVLGLQTGTLTSLTGYIRSAIPGVSTRVIRPRLDPEEPGFGARLDALIEAAEAGAADGAAWQELGWHVASVPHLYLPRNTWRTLAETIVHIIPRSVRVAYRQYSTAAGNLATVPRAQPLLVEAVDAYLAAPDVQVVTNPFGLLDRLPTRRAAELVLQFLESPPTPAAHSLAIWLAAQKLARGDFTDAERDRLGVIVLRLWRDDPARAADELAELVAGLPAGVRSTLTTAEARAGRPRLGYTISHAEEIPAPRAESMAAAVAEQARARVPSPHHYGPDQMLARMVRESLFHRDSERRHLASLLLSASPFGEQIASVLLGVLTDAGSEPSLRPRLATTARYLVAERDRRAMTALVTAGERDVAVPAAHALGHMPLDPVTDQVLRASLTRELDPLNRARMYALGMTGSEGLRTISRSTSAPPWQRAAARWWLAAGPAVRR
jgi:hypothetical protein